MGTRAIITIDGKPFIATHWDGYPSALGADLLDVTDKKDIVKIADEHLIDFTSANVQQQANKKRYRDIARKSKGSKKEYTAKQIESLHKKNKHLIFGLMAARDYPIGSIENYGDWAEYQYDLRGGNWFFRSLSGAYPQSLVNAPDFSRLTKQATHE